MRMVQTMGDSLMLVVMPSQQRITGGLNLDLSAERHLEAATWLAEQKRLLGEGFVRM